MVVPWPVTKETLWLILSPVSSTSQLIISTSSFLDHLQLLQLNSIAAAINVDCHCKPSMLWQLTMDFNNSMFGYDKEMECSKESKS
jgi:hypothetical protein